MILLTFYQKRFGRSRWRKSGICSQETIIGLSKKTQRGVAFEKKNQALGAQLGIYQGNFYQNYELSGSKNNKDSQEEQGAHC